MRLTDIIVRTKPSLSSERLKIPWDEPGFSTRMLAEHLSQSHDAASRRFKTIDRQVAWLHETVLEATPRRILDLGCGPGLYLERFAKLGHSCYGVDFSPASIEYAKSVADRLGLPCFYQLADLRKGEYQQNCDVILLIHGEFNTFSRSELRKILVYAHKALKRDGLFVLEAHLASYVRTLAARPTQWFTSESGLFSETPHLCLRESHWLETDQACIDRYYVVDATRNDVQEYVNALWAYTEQEIEELFMEAGFVKKQQYGSLDGVNCGDDGKYLVYIMGA
jgi:SAM-dependent methyltransferase